MYILVDIECTFFRLDEQAAFGRSERQMDDRHADLLKQGFMKPRKERRLTTIPDAAWKLSLGKAARARYASYGPNFFKD